MRRLLIVLSLCWSVASMAQIETTQYFMNSLPQVVEGNPAFMPKYSFALGLPLSRIGVMYSNNGFCYNDISRVENGKRILDLAQWQSVLPEKTYAVTAAQADLFRLGLRVKGLYLSIHSSARGYSQTMLPKDLATLLVSGTAAYVGKTANISPTINGMSFWETGVGLSFAPTSKIRMGVRLKKLYGVGAGTTEKSDISLSIDENYAMTAAADLRVKTSGAQALSNSIQPKFSDYLQNSGWSGDLGITYRLLPRLNLAASLVDVGYIKWRNNTYDYVLDKSKANYTFSGVDVQDMLNGGADFEAEMDSVKKRFTPTEVKGMEFSTVLPAKMYLSGTFDVTKSFNVGGLFFAEQFMGRTATGVTASLNKHFGRVISTSVSYTVSNRSTNNLGAGISLNFAPVQFYVVGDNLLRLPISLASTGYVNEFMNSTQVFNMRFGINFVWGWKKEVAGGDQQNAEPYNGKKSKSKPMEEDNSRSYNSGKDSSKSTTDVKKQPQPRKKRQSAEVRLRQKSKP